MEDDEIVLDHVIEHQAVRTPLTRETIEAQIEKAQEARQDALKRRLTARELAAVLPTAIEISIRIADDPLWVTINAVADGLGPLT